MEALDSQPAGDSNIGGGESGTVRRRPVYSAALPVKTRALEVVE